MTEEPRGRSGQAAYTAQRDAISKRNDETRKKAQASETIQERVAVERVRSEAAREREQLRLLNERIARRLSARAQ